MNLREQISAAHRLDDAQATELLRRDLQSWWIRLAFALAPGMFQTQRMAWRELLADLGRCRSPVEVNDTCHYWKQRLPANWCLKLPTAKALKLAGRYFSQGEASGPG